MKNQLQFNLGAPPATANLAVRHQKIDPIVVEKIGAPDGSRVMPPLSADPDRLQFQALSREKLDMAIQLAKRDMRKKKTDGEIGVLNGRGRSRSPSPQGRNKTKIVKSRDYRERLKQQESKKKTNALKIKERIGKGNIVKYNKQSKPNVSKESVAGSRPTPNSHLPATTSSPPTRDSNPRRALTKDEQQSFEIQRLQDDIQLSLMKIQDLIQRIVDGDMMRDGTILLRGQDHLHLGEEEGEVRRKLRCEEQATRSARTVYFLQQQVRGIQEDFTRLGAEKIWRVKKSQTLTRLASAHRGAVRALQTLVTQLQNQLPREGPPVGCKDLTVLIKQLTSLSPQSVENEQPDRQDRRTDTQTTLTLLGHIEDLCAVWDEESKIIQASQKTSERGDAVDRQTERGRKPGNKTRVGVLKKQPKHVQGKLKTQMKARQAARSSSPERRAALRAGLAAILGEGNSSNRLTRGPGEGRGEDRTVRFEQDNVPASQKGVLIRPQFHQPRPVSNVSSARTLTGHFADPTMAFNMKAVIPQRNPVTQPRSSSAPNSPRGRNRPDSPRDPPWIPAGTPTRGSKGRSPRSRSHSPGCITCASYTTSMEDLSVELFSEERKPKAQKGHVHFATSRSRPRSRSPSPRLRSMECHREGDLAPRLEPLYSQADLLVKKQEAAARANLQKRRNYQMDVDIDHQTKGEVLSELLFNDILTDTVEELRTIQGDNSVSEEACRMMNTPSLEVMVQRLEQMEIEQEQIRRRWTSMTYDTQEPYRSVADVNEPSDPGPLDLQSLSEQNIVYRPQIRSREGPDLGPILFTKVRKANVSNATHGYTSSHSVNPSSRVASKLPVKLPNDVIEEIQEHVQKYESYLKRTCHQMAGQFDPWLLVKEVSDEIIDECLTEVAGELEDMSSDIVNHLYSSEFAIATDPPSASPLETGS